MTTAKNAIFIELQLENCYLVGGVYWWGFPGGGDEQIFSW